MNDNRAALLKCALDLFAARGYDAVGVQEIVEAAGGTKPTLYHYFGSKPGLLNALLEDHFQQLNQVVRTASAYQGDLTLSLQRVVQAYFGFAHQHRNFYRMQLALWFAPRQSEAFHAIASLNEQQHALIEHLFALASYDHGNMHGRQRAYAASFIGMIHTYIGLWLNSYLELDDPLVYQVVHQFEHGIYS